MKKNLEEALEQIDLLTDERDGLKDRYKDVKTYIGELKHKMDDLKKKEPSEKSNDNDIEDLKKENEILKHELKIVELKLSLKKNGGKNDSKAKAENTDLRSQLSKVTFELETIKLEYAELEKYNTIMKGELTQSKQQLEKLYTSSENIEEQLSIQRPSYDKTRLRFSLGQSTKKSIDRK